MSRYSRNAYRYQCRVEDARAALASRDIAGVEVSERDNRIHLKFNYNAEATRLVKSLPGAKFSWGDGAWSISTRYRKRAVDIVTQIHEVLDAAAADKARAEQSASDAVVAANEAFAQDAKDNPMAHPIGWGVYAREGRWFVSSKYSYDTVRKFKCIKGAKWNGSMWSFPAGARGELQSIFDEVAAEVGYAPPPPVFKAWDEEPEGAIYY